MYPTLQIYAKKTNTPYYYGYPVLYPVNAFPLNPTTIDILISKTESQLSDIDYKVKIKESRSRFLN